MPTKRQLLTAALAKMRGASERARQSLLELEEASFEVESILCEDEKPAPPVKANPARDVPSSEPQTDDEVHFWGFVAAYPGRKRGARTEFELLKTKHRDWAVVCGRLCRLLAGEKQRRDAQRQREEFVPEWPNLQTVINQRKWEEWPAPVTVERRVMQPKIQ